MLPYLGPNGSGKSSFIKTLMREYYPLLTDDMVFLIRGQKVWDVFEMRSTIGIVSNDLQYLFTQDMSGQGGNPVRLFLERRVV